MKSQIFFIFLLLVLVASSTQAQQNPEVFSGTVETLDAAHAKMTVKNDLGQDIPLQVLNPDLLKGVAVGDRVSVETEKPGTAKKVTKLTVPELKAPLETGK
jgi:hypothetical protein